MSYEKLYVLLYFYRKYVLRNAQYMYVLYTNGLIFSLLFVIVGRSSDGSESTYARNKLFLGPGSNLAQAQLFKKGPSLELFLWFLCIFSKYLRLGKVLWPAFFRLDLLRRAFKFGLRQADDFQSLGSTYQALSFKGWAHH